MAEQPKQYNFTPQDYTYQLAMLNHEAGNTIAHDLRRGDMNSAYGQIAGLAETWLNRAVGSGGSMSSVMYHPQLSHFPSDFSGVQQRANTLDPRIRQMFDTYLYNRAQGEAEVFPNVNQYLNRELTDVKYSQNYREWYDRSQLLGAFGDNRNGGETSLQQEFLSNPRMSVRPYEIKVSPDIRLNPTEGDIDAFTNFRETYARPEPQLRPTPLPPERPAEFGQSSRGSDLPAVDALSDGITNSMEAAGRAVAGVAGRAADAFNATFGPNDPPPLDAVNYSNGPPVSPFEFGGNVSGNVPNGSVQSRVDPSLEPLASGVDTASIGTPGGVTLAPAATEPSLVGNASFAGNFDVGKYLAANPDVAGSEQFRANPFSHYLQFGQAEGRDLSPDAGIQRAAPGAFDFSGRNVSQGASNGSFGSGISPGIGDYDFGNVPSGNRGLGRSGFDGTFNPAAYLAANPDVQAASANPWEHYLENGLREGRAIDQAGTRFDPSRYASENADVLSAGTDPTTHFINYGAAEGRGATLVGPDGAPGVMSLGIAPLAGPPGLTQFRAPDGTTFGVGPDQTAATLGAPNAVGTLPPGFSEQGYYLANPDVQAAGIPAAQHYADFGIPEGRSIGPTFSEQAYYDANPDVAASGMDAFDHYRDFGIPEGRTLGEGNVAPLLISADEFNGRYSPASPTAGGSFANSGFNPSDYFAANPDVAASGMDAGTHFQRFGFDEGRSLNTRGLKLDRNFDGAAYLAQNPDVAAAGFNPAQHFLDFGAAEGRQQPKGITPFDFSSINPSAGVPDGSFGSSVVPSISPFDFSSINTSADVPNASFGTGVVPSISPTGFSGINTSAGVPNGAFGLGITPMSSMSNPGKGSHSPITSTSFGANTNVSGFNPNSVGLRGGQPARADWGVTPVSRPGFGGYQGGTNSNGPGYIYGDGASIQARNSQLSQDAVMAGFAIDQVNAGARETVQNYNSQNIGSGRMMTVDPAHYGGFGAPDTPDFRITNFSPHTSTDTLRAQQDASIRATAPTLVRRPQASGGPPGGGGWQPTFAPPLSLR